MLRTTESWYGRRNKTWSRWKSNIKRGYGILGICEIHCRFPGPVRSVVANPVHKILEFAAPETRIKDGMDLKLWKLVHLDG